MVELISNSTAHEDEDPQEPLGPSKRNEVNYRDDSVFIASSKNFPINDYMANAMLSMLGVDGVLEAGGFIREGFILQDGSASVMCHKDFGNRTKLLNEIYRARTVSLAAGDGLAVAMQVFLSDADYHRVVTWLKEQIRMKGDLNYEKPCSPTVVIWFKCCTENASPFFRTKFGTLNIGIE